MSARSAEFVRAIPPAAYLACSWCWVIGMLLPVLLVRDFGLWGWIAFAVPNVIGAASVGWVLRRRDTRTIVQRHGLALDVFMIWTIGFHAVMLSMLFGHQGSGAIATALLPAAMILIFAGLRRGAFAALAISLVACVYVIDRTGSAQTIGLTGERTKIELAFASLPLAFGFLLCPFLDASFIRMTQAMPTQRRRLAFTLGFGVFFLALIGCSLLYAPLLRDELGRFRVPDAIDPGVSFALKCHLFVQALFTCGALAVANEAWLRRRSIGSSAFLLALVIIAIPIAASLIADDPIEVAYQLFLSAYALPFPAYVFICMIPWAWSASRRRRVMVWGAAVALASPLFAAGYFADMYGLLPIGVAIPLLAPFVFGGKPRIVRTRSGARPTSA